MEHVHLWEAHWHSLWIFPILFMIVMFVLGSFVFRRTGAWRRRSAYAGRGRAGWCGPTRASCSGWLPETPARILDRRYASGEITREQREQMNRELDSSPAQSGTGAE